MKKQKEVRKMKKTIRTLLLAAMCCICIAGAVACGNNNDSTVTPPDPGETKSFRVLSELEFIIGKMRKMSWSVMKMQKSAT